MQTVAGSTDALSVTLTFGSLTDAAQCVPFLSCRGTVAGAGYDGANDVMFEANVFDDAGTVKCTLTRSADPGAQLYNFRVTLIEFNAHITVKKTTVVSGQFKPNGDPRVGERDITITAVTPANAFVIPYLQASTSTGMGSGTNVDINLTGATTIVLVGPPSVYCSGYIYSVDDPTGEMLVTRAHDTEAKSSVWTTHDLTIPAVVLAERFLIASCHVPATSAYAQRFSNYTEFLNTTTIRYKRPTGFAVGAQPAHFTAQLVKFAGADVAVQHGIHVWASGDQTENKTITSVNTAKAAAFGSQPYHLFNGSNSAGFSAAGLAHAMNRINLIDATTVTVDRGDSASVNTGGIGYQVLEY